MIQKEKTLQIETIWDNYVKNNKKVLDTKGNELPNIDESRIDAIKSLKIIIQQFSIREIDIYEFKTTIDSFNKRNNLWGFTATKGQMFFNQLVNNNEQNIKVLTNLLIQSISKPNSLQASLSKIDKLEKFCLNVFTKAKDKRKVANPGSVGYFLSYFWQIHDAATWPILYTSQINAYKELDIWEDKTSQKKTYQYFYSLNEDIKKVLELYTKKEISNWEIEHAFWNFKGNPNKLASKKKEIITIPQKQENLEITLNASFDLSDYLIPKVARLVELGSDVKKSASTKGSEYERLVSEIFKQLDFEIEFLGQGSGRNPDVIIRHRRENTAFIVDAKAYTNGYSMGTDDRAIREYINHYCPKLIKEGYKKIGFIIVSNSFKSNLDGFINEITWNTDIKRFILLSSEALLYLLAYKTKDRLGLSLLIEKLIGFNNPVISKDIIAEFDDV